MAGGICQYFLAGNHIAKGACQAEEVANKNAALSTTQSEFIVTRKI